MRRSMSTFGIGVLALLVVACSTPAASPAASSSASAAASGELAGVTWTLTSYDLSGTSTDVPDDVVADLHIDGTQISGSAGCNSFMGTVTVTGTSVKVGPLATTKKACEGDAADVEAAYLANLQKAASFSVTALGLKINDSTGAPILVFEPGPANPLEGSWSVTGYNNGKGAVTTPKAGTTLTAMFTLDQISGSSGCNTYNGGYTIDGTTIKIGPLAATRMACAQDVMDQETAFLTALQAATTVEQSGANVTLRDSAGAIQVSLIPG